MHKFLFIACTFPSLITCAHYIKMKKSLKLLKELKQFFEQIAAVLSATAIEVCPLLTVLQQKAICPSLCIRIKAFLDEDMTFAQAWEKAVFEYCHFLLSDRTIDDIVLFGKQFGLGSLDKQIKLCACSASVCSDSIAEIKTNMEKNGKLSLTCSALFGAFLYIVLM